MATHSAVADSGEVFQVVPMTKKVVVPASHKILGTVGDHCSEVVTFKCPQFIDGHDVEKCAEHYVIFKNALGVSRRVDIESDDIRQDGEYIYLTWVIEREVTREAGNISFSLYYVDKDATGTIIYQWSTAPNTDCQILAGLQEEESTAETLHINANGVYDVEDYSYANVNVLTGGGNLQAKKATADKNGEFIILPDTPYDGMSKVILTVAFAEYDGAFSIV